MSAIPRLSSSPHAGAVITPPAGKAHKGYVLWVPGVGINDTGVAFRGYAEALAQCGYTSVGLRVRKGPCTSPSVLLAQIESVALSLPEPPILIGHSFGGALVQLMLCRRPAASSAKLEHWPTRGILLASAPVASPGVYVLYLLRLLCVAPLGLIMTVLFFNPAFLVGGGWFCRSESRLRSLGFVTAQDVVTVRGRAEPFGAYHAGFVRGDSMLMVVIFLFHTCVFKAARGAEVRVIGTMEDKIAPPFTQRAIGRAWGVEPQLVRGVGHFLADEGWETSVVPEIERALDELVAAPAAMS